MIEHLKGVRVETIRKRADREMHERIISGRQRDEDDDDEPEIYADSSGGGGSRVGGEAQSHRFSNVGDYFTHIPAEVPVPDQQQRQRKRSTAYYLHPAYHYAVELSYDDDLTAAFTRVVERLSRSPLDAAYMKSFREGVENFAEPSAIVVRDCIDDESGRQGPTRLRVGRLRSESADSAIHGEGWTRREGGGDGGAHGRGGVLQGWGAELAGGMSGWREGTT
ncbi:hypothetical protein Taro_015539 [Colocasia esculenta]|uniref:Uncharacterized protein n=1 Tax=Colocasia esculenta TaxID=4460 RepID=A0A843UHT6_COLES|nr:hypothetical protein [Colocasia esculenta]